MSVDRLKRVIAADEYHHAGHVPNNFLDKLDDKDLARKAVAMFKDEYLLDFINVEATYTTSQEMPEELRHALPDMEELKKLL